MVLKISPPLAIDDAQLDQFVRAIEQIVDSMHSSNRFWSEGLGLAKRVMTSL